MYSICASSGIRLYSENVWIEAFSQLENLRTKKKCIKNENRHSSTLNKCDESVWFGSFMSKLKKNDVIYLSKATILTLCTGKIKWKLLRNTIFFSLLVWVFFSLYFQSSHLDFNIYFLFLLLFPSIACEVLNILKVIHVFGRKT